VSETKIDSTFKDSLFEVDGYKLQRRDRTDSGGGIATFMRTDIPLDLIFTWNFVSTNLQKFAVILLYQQIKPSSLLE
jgi:hypothetical protein